MMIEQFLISTVSAGAAVLLYSKVLVGITADASPLVRSILLGALASFIALALDSILMKKKFDLMRLVGGTLAYMIGFYLVSMIAADIPEPLQYALVGVLVMLTGYLMEKVMKKY